MMAGIRGKNTRPEKAIRKALHSAGYRFRLHRRDLPGSPDIVLPKYKAVIFVHGCFWHHHADCPLFKLPSSRTDFWRAKLEANAQRDARNIAALAGAGWRILVIWECGIRSSAAESVKQACDWIQGSKPHAEIFLKEGQVSTGNLLVEQLTPLPST